MSNFLFSINCFLDLSMHITLRSTYLELIFHQCTSTTDSLDILCSLILLLSQTQYNFKIKPPFFLMQLPSKFPHFCLWCHFLQTCQSRNHGTITNHTESYTKAIPFFLWKSSWILSLIFQCHWLHPGPCSLLSSCLDYSGKLLLFSLILSLSFSQDSSKLSVFISQGHS